MMPSLNSLRSEVNSSCKVKLSQGHCCLCFAHVLYFVLEKVFSAVGDLNYCIFCKVKAKLEIHSSLVSEFPWSSDTSHCLKYCFNTVNKYFLCGICRAWHVKSIQPQFWNLICLWWLSGAEIRISFICAGLRCCLTWVFSISFFSQKMAILLWWSQSK